MMISAITSSATERVLEYGALNTGTPRPRASPSATWLVPMQKQPTATSFFAAVSTAGVSRVRDLMPTTWTLAIRSISAASSKARGSRSMVL